MGFKLEFTHWIQHNNVEVHVYSSWLARHQYDQHQCVYHCMSLFVTYCCYCCFFFVGVGHTLSRYHIWVPIDIVMLTKIGTEWVRKRERWALNGIEWQRQRQRQTTHHLYAIYGIWFNGISLNGLNFTVSEQIVILSCTNVSRLFRVFFWWFLFSVRF